MFPVFVFDLSDVLFVQKYLHFNDSSVLVICRYILYRCCICYSCLFFYLHFYVHSAFDALGICHDFSYDAHKIIVHLYPTPLHGLYSLQKLTLTREILSKEQNSLWLTVRGVLFETFKMLLACPAHNVEKNWPT